MEEILHQLICSLSDYLQGFCYIQTVVLSEDFWTINSMRTSKKQKRFEGGIVSQEPLKSCFFPAGNFGRWATEIAWATRFSSSTSQHRGESFHPTQSDISREVVNHKGHHDKAMGVCPPWNPFQVVLGWLCHNWKLIGSDEISQFQAARIFCWFQGGWTRNFPPKENSCHISEQVTCRKKTPCLVSMLRLGGVLDILSSISEWVFQPKISNNNK